MRLQRHIEKERGGLHHSFVSGLANFAFDKNFDKNDDNKRSRPNWVSEIVQLSKPSPMDVAASLVSHAEDEQNPAQKRAKIEMSASRADTPDENVPGRTPSYNGSLLHGQPAVRSSQQIHADPSNRMTFSEIKVPGLTRHRRLPKVWCAAKQWCPVETFRAGEKTCCKHKAKRRRSTADTDKSKLPGVTRHPSEAKIWCSAKQWCPADGFCIGQKTCARHKRRCSPVTVAPAAPPRYEPMNDVLPGYKGSLSNMGILAFTYALAQELGIPFGSVHQIVNQAKQGTHNGTNDVTVTPQLVKELKLAMSTLPNAIGMRWHQALARRQAEYTTSPVHQIEAS